MNYFSYFCTMRQFLLLLALLTIGVSLRAQTYPPTAMPQLEFALQLRVQIGEAYSAGQTPHGRRIVIPITGGTFEGPLLQGTIIPGGADYQLANSEGTRTELEAIYSIRTDDGINIHVRNRGLVCDGKDADGKPYYYFKAAPQFEAPQDSRYAWLNNALFVCQPEWVKDFNGIVLNVWKVK
jgi:hypothetical protein